MKNRLALAALLAVLSCGGDGSSEPSTKPLPVLVGVSPTLIVAGTGATTLTLTGSGFVSSSQARWNDGDRITHYQNDHTLTVDLPATDVAALTTAKVTVVNGAPGGGTSGIVNVPVGYPNPKITSVSPTSVPIQSSSSPNTQITIIGSGFVSQSSVRVGSSGFASVTSVTPTQIVASVSYFYLSTPGAAAITVTNPTPGGGTSNAADFGVTYPTPTITNVSPDSALTGSGFTLTVNGTGFGSATVIRWNGVDRTTTFVSATRVTAAIAASDIASASTATISVFNPAPGGGASNTINFRVREAAPVISSISPGVITAGGGGTQVTINGTNFRSGATVQWDGQTRIATLVSSTAMTVLLTAGDVASAHTGKLTVTNPGASGVSNALNVAVVPLNPTLAIARTITLTHADLVYDDGRGVIYASVPSSATQNPNSVVRIDPSSGQVTATVAVGSNPGVMAITDDGQYLYVGLLGTPKIVRVALATFSKDIELSVPGDSFLGSAYAEDLVPIPGSPQMVAASTFYTSVSPRNAGTVLFDNDVQRTSKGPGHTGSNRITRGPSDTRIYGYNNETTEFGFRSLLVSADGLHEETVKAGLISGFSSDIWYSGGFVYASTGDVIDVAAMQKVGTIPATGIAMPDATNARVHFLSGTSIKTYHYTAFTSLGGFSDASLASHTKLIRWGTDGLAVGGGSSIVLLRGSLVAP